MMTGRDFFLSTVGVVIVATPAWAQQTLTVSAEPAPLVASDADTDASDSALIVTGVRGSRARSVADSPVPIDVISPQELKATGRTGLKEILGNIIPSLTMPALGGGGTSASVRPISIRGLSGDYLLVLVNGKRRHTTSLINNLSRVSGGSTPVDVDLIPTNAIGRIEVLRDGAAAQYGSDAISGVINLILDNAPEGGEFTVTAGQLYEKGAGLLQQTLGYGTRVGDGGFFRISVEGKYHDRADSSGEAVPRTFPLVNGQPDPREGNVDHYVATGYGRSNRDKIINGAYNAELPLGALTAYSFSTLSYRDIKDLRGTVFPSPTGYGGQANAGGLNALPQLYPAGFNAYRRIWEWDFQSTLGLRGTVSGWDFDVSSSYGRDHVKLGAANTLNPSIGPSSKSAFFAGKQIQDLWVNNLDISRDYDLGFAKPLTVALGVEHRWERFQNVAGEPDSYRDGGYIIPSDGTPFGLVYGGRTPSPGVPPFTGTSPVDATSLSRNNIAAYVDLSTNIIPAWFVGVAGRFEHYDDSSGNTASWKVSTRFDLGGGFAVRGGVNTGFRAPSLAQTGFSTTQNTATVVGNDRFNTTSKFLPVDSAAAIALGAKPLKPEKSLNFTGGVTYESGAFRLTIDGYQIRVDDRIVKTEFLGTPANNGGIYIDPATGQPVFDTRTGRNKSNVQRILENAGVTAGVDSAQFFTNAIDTRTRGVDVVAEYTLRSSAIGTFRLNAAYSYNKTKILHISDNPAVLNALPTAVTLFGRQAQGDLVASTPRDKLLLSNDWTLTRVHVLTRLTRFGKYVESSNVPSGDQHYGAKWVTDLDIGYDLTDQVTLSAGANNLFNVYPQKNGVINADGSGLYGNFAPFGLSGGFYYARVAARF
jgi:iron complex outermembrane receptor protein